MPEPRSPRTIRILAQIGRPYSALQAPARFSANLSTELAPNPENLSHAWTCAATRQLALVMASDWFDAELGNAIVDLATIDIQGGAYELLEHMMETSLTRPIRNIQGQFHEDVIPDAAALMRAIHDKFSDTHRLTFQEEFVWGNWALR